MAMQATSVNNTIGGGTAGAASGRVPRADDQASFENEMMKQAEAVIDRITDKFVATALVYPMLEQMGDSRFKTEYFDGGFTEDAFASRLNMYLADEISASSRLPVSQVLNRQLIGWLHNNPTRAENVANTQRIDTLG